MSGGPLQLLSWLLLLGAAQRAQLGLRAYQLPPAQAVPGTALAAVRTQSCMPPGVCRVAFAGAVLDIDGGPPCAAPPASAVEREGRQIPPVETQPGRFRDLRLPVDSCAGTGRTGRPAWLLCACWCWCPANVPAVGTAVTGGYHSGVPAAAAAVPVVS